MSTQSPRPERGEDTEDQVPTLRQFLSGVTHTIKHWDELDTQAKQDYRLYYGYLIFVVVGSIAVFVLTVWFRLR